jgi:hypothetical protein
MLMPGWKSRLPKLAGSSFVATNQFFHTPISSCPCKLCTQLVTGFRRISKFALFTQAWPRRSAVMAALAERVSSWDDV